MTSDDPAPVRAGEPRERALPRLVAQHGGRLFALARRFCGNEEEARDLVQETFLAAWKSWETFEGRSDPGTWLYTIAAHRCQRMHRPRAGEPSELAPLDPAELFAGATQGVAPEEGEPLAALVRREAKERLETAIQSLPLEFRLPLVLREIVGLELDDVARILGLEPVTVRTAPAPVAGASAQQIMTRRVEPSAQGQLQGANSSLRGVAGLIGPGLFTLTFARAIDPGRAAQMPGAPFVLASALVAGAVVVAWRSTRPSL